MGFFHALGEVGKNSKNFKQWEQNEQDKKAQREKLHNISQLSEKELEAAKKKGEVIMNVIDTMDTHSEEVSENVETATMPIAQIAPAATLLASGYLSNKFIMNPASEAVTEAYKTFRNSDDGKKLKDLIGEIKKYKEANPNKLTKFKIYFDEITDAFSKRNLKELSNSDDATIKSIYNEINQIASKYKEIPAIKNINKKTGLGLGIILGTGILSYIVSNVLAAKLQVKSSRIARWQSRQDLNDAKYFVEYTDEQIKEAQENLKNKKEENKGFSLFKKKDNLEKRNGFISTIVGTVKDNEKYENWKTNYNQEDKKVKRNLTEKDLIEAEKEKEVIQRVTKEINNNAEEYGENMETAAGVLIGGTPFLGAGIGAIVNMIINKTGMGEKISEKSFKKLLNGISNESEKKHVSELFEAIKKTNANPNASLVEKTMNLRNMSEFSEIILSNGKTNSVKGIGKIIEISKKALNVALTTKSARNTLIGVLGGLATGIVGAFIGLKLQKEASRVGRFKAKREIEENPLNFIGYTKEEYNTVQDTKAQKESFGKKIVNYITFIPRCIKEYFEYEKYNKTEAKAQKELTNELVKSTTITKEQLSKAEDLQRKLFVTFENVDDKSQEYSESTEAVTEMAAPFIPYVGLMLASLPFVIGGVKLYKSGAINATESISGFLAKHTKFLKGKTATKYTDEVAANISSIIQNQRVSAKYQNNEILNLFKLGLSQTKNPKELFEQLGKCINNAKGQENELEALIREISKLDIFKKLGKSDLTQYIESITSEKTLDKLKSVGIDISYDNIETIKKCISQISDDGENLGDFIEKNIDKFNIPNVKISQLTDFIKEAGIDVQKYSNIINEIKEHTNGINVTGMANAYVEGQIKSGAWRKAATELANNTTGSLNRMINSLLNSSITDEQALKIYSNFVEILNNMPAENLSKIINTTMEEFGNNPDKFLSAINDGSLQKALLTKGLIKTGAIASTTWSALCIVLTFCMESAFASMQKKSGKLGVMKALEELDDVKYYANENIENK